MELRTEYQTKKAQLHKQIAEEFIQMVNDGSSKTMVTAFLRKKYNIHSDNTVYRIRREYRNAQVYSLSKAIGAEGLMEAIDNICEDFKQS